MLGRWCLGRACKHACEVSGQGRLTDLKYWEVTMMLGSLDIEDLHALVQRKRCPYAISRDNNV